MGEKSVDSEQLLSSEAYTVLERGNRDLKSYAQSVCVCNYNICFKLDKTKKNLL